jgi:hypothetical protein
MAEYTSDIVARLARRVLFDEWRAQMAAGHLTETGLLAIRARLNSTHEFARDPERDLMLMNVAMAIAVGRGIDLHDTPGGEAPGLPEDARGIE